MARSADSLDRISLTDALQALKQAVREGALDRAQTMASRLLAAGTIDVTLLIHLAEHLSAAGTVAPAVRLSRIAALLVPESSRPYLIVIRAAAKKISSSAYRPGTWAFVCDPDNPEGARRAAALAVDAGNPGHALIYLLRVLGLRPRSAMAWTNVGLLRAKTDDHQASKRDLARAVCLAPGLAFSWFAVGNSASRDFNHIAAATGFRRALVLDPLHHAAHHNLGQALRRQGRVAQPITSLRRSLVLEPSQDHVLVVLGQLRLMVRDIEGMRRYFYRARAANPENPEAQFFGALGDLRTGRLDAGWQRYFWHLKLGFPKLTRRQRLPSWPDQEVDPTGTLVWNDQAGVGEEVMYLGALPQLVERVGRLAISCTSKLAPLLRRSFPEMTVTTCKQTQPEDLGLGARPAEVPLILAVAALRRSLMDFPVHQGYLRADPAVVARLRERYGDPDGRPLIGISWSSPRGFQGPDKAVPLADWGPVFQTLNARFISLQYHADPNEIAEARARHGVDILVDPDLDTFADLDNLAAQISAMDRVLSISNITAHLAGALGQPVEMIYPSEIALLWYWFHDRSDSPWYPSMTIHRPPPGGSRAGLMQCLANYLHDKTTPDAAPRR